MKLVNLLICQQPAILPQVGVVKKIRERERETLASDS